MSLFEHTKFECKGILHSACSIVPSQPGDTYTGLQYMYGKWAVCLQAWNRLCAVSLCSGESVSPEQCFTMSEFPPFLKHPAPHSCSSCHMPLSSYPSSSPSSHETKPSLLCNGLDANSRRPSAFTPVDSSKTGYITPDLFGNPTLGKAVASSTPAPRTLQFVTSDFRGTNFKMGGSLYEPARGGAAVSLKDGAPAGRIQFGGVKGVLDFGSGRRTEC